MLTLGDLAVGYFLNTHSVTIRKSGDAGCKA